MALPEGEIIFSGIRFGNKFIKTDDSLSYDQKLCEQKLVRFKGKNKRGSRYFYSKKCKNSDRL